VQKLQGHVHPCLRILGVGVLQYLGEGEEGLKSDPDREVPGSPKGKVADEKGNR